MDGVRDLPGGLVVQTTCCQCRGLRLNPWSGTKNWCFWAVELEKTLESPLDCKEIKPVNPKGNQSWIFTEELMLNPKLHYFGHLMWRTNSLEKTLMPGKIEGRRRRGLQRMRWLDGITELSGHGFDQTLGDSEGQWSLACCSLWGCKELDMAEWLTNNKKLDPACHKEEPARRS